MQRNKKKQNDAMQRGSTAKVSTSKSICKRLVEECRKESSTRLTRKKSKEMESNINLISDRELRLLKRNNKISTTTPPSVNGPSTTVEKDPKVPLNGGSTETRGTKCSFVKSPPIRKDKSDVPVRQQHPRIASKAAMKSIGKIVRFERKST